MSTLTAEPLHDAAVTPRVTVGAVAAALPPQPRPQGADAPSAAEAAPPKPAAGLRRRRLWELPPEAHDLLLALSLPPDALRKIAEKAVGRLHQARCRLGGSDTDLLYGVLHDLDHRNALSDALQRALDLRHAQVLRQARLLREREALQQAWKQALRGPDMVAWLWALLTHPQGPSLQEAALLEACTWLFAQARAGLAATARGAAAQQALAESAQRLQQARQRAQQLQAELARGRQAAQEQEAAWRGEIARLRQELAAAQAAVQEMRQRSAATPAPSAGPGPSASGPALPRAAAAPACGVPVLQPGASSPAPWQRAGALAGTGTRTGVAAAARHTGQPMLRPGHRVLCVGGMPRAEGRYRALVENTGARFEYHDGGMEDGALRLQQQLTAADLVLCQAGCLNHAAYRTIKGHCKRLDKPCLFLERPSLSHFARLLQTVSAAPATEVSSAASTVAPVPPSLIQSRSLDGRVAQGGARGAAIA